MCALALPFQLFFPIYVGELYRLGYLDRKSEGPGLIPWPETPGLLGSRLPEGDRCKVFMPRFPSAFKGDRRLLEDDYRLFNCQRCAKQVRICRRCARVSKADGSQSLDLQRDALCGAGVDAASISHDHAHTGQLVWVEHERKNSVLFVKLLEQLRSQYRRARRVVLILDNYRIHKSRMVERWLVQNDKFQLLFQPVYHPWVNVIERLCKAMHDTVTRNHRCRSMFELCQHIARFLDIVQPFPGSGHGVAHLRSAIL